VVSKNNLISASPYGTHLGAGDEGFIQPVQGLGRGEHALFCCRGARRGFLVRERHRLLAAHTCRHNHFKIKKYGKPRVVSVITTLVITCVFT
jgi:hypothetical protein